MNASNAVFQFASQQNSRSRNTRGGEVVVLQVLRHHIQMLEQRRRGFGSGLTKIRLFHTPQLTCTSPGRSQITSGRKMISSRISDVVPSRLYFQPWKSQVKHLLRVHTAEIVVHEAIAAVRADVVERLDAVVARCATRIDDEGLLAEVVAQIVADVRQSCARPAKAQSSSTCVPIRDALLPGRSSAADQAIECLSRRGAPCDRPRRLHRGVVDEAGLRIKGGAHVAP